MFCCPVSLGLSRDDRLMQQKSSVCLWQSAIITSPREPNNKREREREKKEKHDFLLLPLFVFIAGSRKKRVIEWEKERIFSWPKCPTVCIVVCVLVPLWRWRSIYCNPMLVNIFFFTSLVGWWRWQMKMKGTECDSGRMCIRLHVLFLAVLDVAATTQRPV